MVEHFTCNEDVAGSIPASGSMIKDIRDTITAKEMIEALSLLPPETLIYGEGGAVGVYAPELDDLTYFPDGTPAVTIS